MRDFIVHWMIRIPGNFVDQEARAADHIIIFKMAAIHSMFEARTVEETWVVLLHRNFILVSFFDTGEHTFDAMNLINQF